MSNKRFTAKIFNEVGFSLAGAMVGAAILGVLTMVFTQLISNTMDSQRMIQQRQAVIGMQMSTIGLLSDRKVCELNFKDATVGTTNPTRLISGTTASPIVNLQESVKYEGNLIQLIAIRLINYKAYANAGRDLYKGTAEVQLEFKGVGNGMTGKSFGRSVLLAVEKKAYNTFPTIGGTGNQIETCIAIGNDEDDIWRMQSNGDIYYSGFNVGIGTDNPSKRLHVLGDAQVTGGLDVTGNVLATAYFHSSDERLKKDIKSLDNVEKLQKIRGVKFHWKDQENSNYSMGLLAQEVEKIFPEAVTTNPKTGYKMVAYDLMVAPLIESNNQLANKIKQLEKEQKELRNELKAIKKSHFE